MKSRPYIFLAFDSTKVQKAAIITRTGSYLKDMTFKWIETAEKYIDWSLDFPKSYFDNAPNWFMDHISRRNQTEEVILLPKSRKNRDIISKFKYDTNRIKSMVELYLMRPEIYENDSDGKFNECNNYDQMTRKVFDENVLILQGQFDPKFNFDPILGQIFYHK